MSLFGSWAHYELRDLQIWYKTSIYSSLPYENPELFKNSVLVVVSTCCGCDNETLFVHNLI